MQRLDTQGDSGRPVDRIAGFPSPFSTLELGYDLSHQPAALFRQDPMLLGDIRVDLVSQRSTDYLGYVKDPRIFGTGVRR